MNCKEYRELIEDALDISLQGDPEKRVRLHLEHCDACRSYFDRRRAEHVALFTGINAGMMTVGCSWGYRGRAELEGAGADMVIDHASELEKIFE